MMVIQDLTKTGDDLKFKIAAMPIPFRQFLVQNHWADILHEAYGALPYIKYLKSVRMDHNRPNVGGVNFGNWLVDFGFNGPLRQYFSLYRAVSQRQGERGEKR